MPNAVGVTGGLALAMVVVCVACSTPPRTSAGPAIAPPVAARILPPFQGQVVFDVNQPVYVAVFDVRPFMAIQLLFPGPNDEGLVDAGVHGVAPFYLTDAREERQALYAPAAGVSHGGKP